MMLSRSTFGRNAPRALQKQCVAASRRGMASAATPGLPYDVSEAVGVKFANSETAGPTSALALVAKAGTRYQPLPGYSDALEQFAFKSTVKRSALRITREVELLGGEFSSRNSREDIVLRTKFFSNDLPYFAELLAEVASQTKYPGYEFNEHVSELLHLKQHYLSVHPELLALEAAHGAAFHHGLGSNISETAYEKYVSVDALADFARDAYSKPNIALVGSGLKSEDLSKWVSTFFRELPSHGVSSPYKVQKGVTSKYYGGQARIASKAGNAVVIGFPGSSAFGTSENKPEISVLAALLGGESTIKWTPGFSLLSQATKNFTNVYAATRNHAYSDTGLLTINITGKADQVASASKSAVDAVKKVAAGGVAAEDIKKASALAKFRAFEHVQQISTGLDATGSALVNGHKPYGISEVAKAFDSVTEQQVKDAANSLVSGKATFVAVGDLPSLPYAEDVGLTV